MNAAGSVARLKITLDDIGPAVMRRLEIPVDLRLDRLHLILQAAVGWTNTHLTSSGSAISDGGFPIRSGTSVQALSMRARPPF